MKIRISIIVLGLCSATALYSQDCFDRVAQQAVVIDSLQKVINLDREYNQQFRLDCQKISKDLSDTIKNLRTDLTSLEKFRSQRAAVETRIKVKSDSIALLRNQLAEKNRQINDEKKNSERKAGEEREKGKDEALAVIVNSYKNKPFDDLIKSSTKLSVERDIQLVGNNAEIKQVLSDLEKYFVAEELLAKRLDVVQIKNAQAQLDKIKQNSTLLAKLKEDIEYYPDFNNAFKKTIDKLIDLDKRTLADREPNIQKLKFNEIVIILTDYMYNYYDYGNYPHLSDIILEIIKRKRADADADITDLLQKL